ncbi:DNA-directed RNA polymerase subunit delta [Heliorestis convoluta]|uniref:RNAP delta factor n=1 Tax=Heliorestis convoluta TaxID=356322 RepID=A0A5Q2N0K2_9FIRM|nr:DNA-directed RNA polymerase subunit delta [Heliorestis convoluta]QGG47076.1 DNA-directed RNA polymerase delta subunit, putative [Heliorestis convoluta]
MDHQELGRRFSEAEQLVQVLREKGEALHFRELIAEVLKKKGHEDPSNDVRAVARLYTQMNLDMRFVFLGDGLWGLRNWSEKGVGLSLLNKDYDDDNDSGDDEDYQERENHYSRNRDED